MKLWKLLFFITYSFYGFGAAALEEEEIYAYFRAFSSYHLKNIQARQLSTLRDAFMQKVKVWEKIRGRRMHPIDLLYPYMREEKLRNGNPIFIIDGFSQSKVLFLKKYPDLSKEEKRFSYFILMAFIPWNYASNAFSRRLTYYGLTKSRHGFEVNKNRYDLLFMTQIKLECARLIKLGRVYRPSYFEFPKKAEQEKKDCLIKMQDGSHLTFNSLRNVSDIKAHLREEELEKFYHILERPHGLAPVDLPLYGLREEPPLEEINPKSLWERMLGLQEKREVPPCLRDPSVMEGEGTYLDMITPKGFSVFAHAFPEFRDEILGFEAYGMDRGPVIYRGLMDPPPYPVEMITDGEGEEHPSGAAAAAASSVSATCPAAASSADIDLPAAAEGVDPETVMLLRKRR